MHEAAIAYNAMEVILEKAKENNLVKINKVRVKVGELTGVMPDALRFAFESASRGTIAENAVLEIERVKPTAVCEECKITFDIDHFNKLCPSCGKFSSSILTGYELYVNTLEGD
jgi:hydrogenase nickel incorporation protein HypA/HybF